MMISTSFRNRRSVILIEVAAMTVLIAVLDWKVDAEVPLGFLYLIPVLVASRIFNEYALIALGALYTGLAEMFDNFQWSPRSGVPRDLLYFAAFTGIGLFNRLIAVSRRAAVTHVLELEQENQARRDAEEQLQVLVESSPVAILVADTNGKILVANDAAQRLFDMGSELLRDKSIGHYLPSLSSVPALRDGRQAFRTVMQCKGYRSDGEVFMADVWFSTYGTSVGPRLAAMVIDASDELRDREKSGLHQLLASSRILVGAVSHEIRNVCGAIAVIHQNLTRCEHLDDNQDFEALGTLVLTLENIASMELRQTISRMPTLDLRGFLEELRIVIGPSLRDQGISLHWELPSELPEVCADTHSLMQLFLNLTNNSARAIAGKSDPWIRIAVEASDRRVFIRVTDNGGGIKSPGEIFRPFQQNAQATGLGLYLSRALLRSFGGNLHYESTEDGAMLTVEVNQDIPKGAD